MAKTAPSLRLLRRLTAATALFLAFALIFLATFQMFEAISMQAMLRTNAEFSAQVSTISDSMHSIINTIGTQVFYISSTAKLRRSTSMTTNERVFAIRELWQYVTASAMLHSIYVFNEKLDQVYTTDNTYSSGSFDSFYDRDAVQLFKGRSRDNRMQLLYRVFENAGDYPPEIELFSYQVFEVNARGEVGDSGIMLNLYPSWFAENLLNFSGESYIILSPSGYVVASQSDRLLEPATRLMPRIQSRGSGYLIDDIGGERTVCFFSPLETNDWYCLRFVSYAESLPGLARLRTAALWVLAALLAVLAGLALVALIRIYLPYRHMANMLNDAPVANDGPHLDTVQRLSQIMTTSWDTQREEELRLWLSGKPGPPGIPEPAFPAVLLMAAAAPGEGPRRLMAAAAPGATLVQREGMTVALCAPSVHLDVAQLLSQLAAALNCRWYYSLPIQRLSDLPAHYEALLELRRLRFLSPGQRVFSQTLMNSRTQTAGDMEKHIAACFTAARTGDAEATGEAFAQLVSHLHQCGFTDLLFVLKRLDMLLDAALPESMRGQGTQALERVLDTADDPSALHGYFMPRLKALAALNHEQRHSRGRDVAAQVLRRLEQGFRDPGLGAQTIAEEMGLSAAYLRQQFYGDQGMSIGDKLNQLRVEEACRLLRETGLTVEAIAQQIGLENTKYLFVLFKKLTGVTPRQYRKGLADGTEAGDREAPSSKPTA